MKKISAIILAFLIAVTAFGGCGKKQNENGGTAENADTKQAETQNETASDSGIISVFSYKPDTFCPVLSQNAANLQMLGILYDGLIELDDTLTPQPCLAESWSVSENGREWTVNLKSGVLWHDGSGFEARDAVYTVNQIKRVPESLYYYNVSEIASITAEGQNKLKIKLTAPDPNFINLLYFPIVKYSSGNINAEEYRPNGTGPYAFEDRNDGNMFYLVRNDNWWGGKAKNKEIRVRLLPDRDTALYAFSSGSIDITSAENLEWGKFADAATSTYKETKTPIYNFLGINHKNVLLAMDEVRLAISEVINRQEIVDEAAMGYADAANAPVRKEWYVSEGQDFNFVQNVNDAKKILLDNEWTENDGKYRKKVGRKEVRLKFDILINEDNTVRSRAAEVIKKNLEEFGFEISITKVSDEEYDKRISSGRYDAFLGSYSLAPNLNFDFMIGDGNIFHYKNDELNYVLGELKNKTEKSEIVQKYAETVNLLNQLCPIVGLYFENGVVIYNNKIQGDVTPSYFDLYRNIEKLYTKEVQSK